MTRIFFVLFIAYIFKASSLLSYIPSIASLLSSIVISRWCWETPVCCCGWVELTWLESIQRFTPGWTLWRPLCPQRRRAWRAHLGGRVGQQSGPLEKRESSSWSIVRAFRPLWRSSRKCHRWKSSWWPFPSWRYQSLGEPAWAPCRCMRSTTGKEKERERERERRERRVRRKEV